MEEFLLRHQKNLEILSKAICEQNASLISLNNKTESTESDTKQHKNHHKSEEHCSNTLTLSADDDRSLSFSARNAADLITQLQAGRIKQEEEEEEIDDYPLITDDILECSISYDDEDDTDRFYNTNKTDCLNNAIGDAVPFADGFSLLKTLLVAKKASQKTRKSRSRSRKSTKNKPADDADITLSTLAQESQVSGGGASSAYKRHKCDICPYSSDLKSNLTRHQKSHTNDRPFHCSYCEYRSITKQHLERHMSIHTNEFAHACELCDYKTREKNKLTIHMMKHTNIYPHQCTVCNYKTRWKNNLTNHMIVHNGNYRYRCTKCPYKTRWKNALKYHKVKHTQGCYPESDDLATTSSPYKCEHCTYTSVVKSSFICHMKSHFEELGVGLVEDQHTDGGVRIKSEYEAGPYKEPDPDCSELEPNKKLDCESQDHDDNSNNNNNNIISNDT